MIDQKHNRSPDKKSQKDRIKEITARLEEGVKAVFESNRYKEYLACMSKFHSYSLNNCLLIAAQYPTATAVAGYRASRIQSMAAELRPAGPQGRERDQDPGTVQI